MPEGGAPANSGASTDPSAGAEPGDQLLEALSSCLEAWQHAQSWDGFLEALASVQEAAMQRGHLALHDVCVVLHERIEQLSETAPCPDDEQCAVLAAWPSFASAWLESPGEPHLGELLVEFLAHPMWPEPLAEDQAEFLRVMLGIESGAHGSESLIQVAIDTLDASEDGEGSDDGLPGYDGLSGYAKLGTATPGGGKIVPDVRARMAASMEDSETEQASVEPGGGEDSGREPGLDLGRDRDDAETLAHDAPTFAQGERAEADMLESSADEHAAAESTELEAPLSESAERDEPALLADDPAEVETAEPALFADEPADAAAHEPTLFAEEHPGAETAERAFFADEHPEAETAERAFFADGPPEAETAEPAFFDDEHPEAETAEPAFFADEPPEAAADEPALFADEPLETAADEPALFADEHPGAKLEQADLLQRDAAETQSIDTAAREFDVDTGGHEADAFPLDDSGLADSAAGALGPGDPEPIPPEFLNESLEDSDAALDADAAAGAMPDTANEMLHLLIAEASQIATVLADIMPLATSESAGESERREALEHFAEQVERFNGAVELLGLDGLCRAGQHFHHNIIWLATGGEALGADTAELLVNVCTAVPEYLEHPTDASAAAALTALLAHSAWPRPADPEWAAEVEALLASPVVDIEDEDGEERAVSALPEDVSLELPDDVDMEVLDGLLQDLPGQTAEFSRSVESLVSGGTQHDVEVAQRIAHTVKGAANTVGVAGLANLTHHLEDILLVLGKHGVVPGPGLSEMLVRSADCLESMGEALLGQCAPPADALETLQNVLDWANTIDKQGIEAVADEAMPAAHHTESDDQAEELDNAQRSVTPATATQMVRVPAPLVDDLLRLVGETIILTGQVQERLDVTAREAHNMRKQYMLVQQLGQEMEELIDLQDLSLPQQRAANGEGFDALEFDQYNELHTCSRRLVEAATDTREIGQTIEDHLVNLSDMLSDQSRLNRESQEAVLKTRMVAVQTIVPRLQRSVRQASRLTGKSVELRCLGTDTLMDSDVLGQLLDPLMHVLRNAVDHGIEAEAVRVECGKNIEGEIRLEFQREGNHIIIRCEDDGAGLDLEAIRKAAEARNISGEDDELSEEELTQLILKPNFSTRAEATQLSGRGIGLNAVNTQVLNLGGSLRLHSETGSGCQIIMRLPLTLVSTHALLVRATSRTLAVSTRGVEQILHPDSGEVSRLGDQVTYRMVDAVYPCTSLTRLLGLPGERRTADRERSPALLVQGDGGLNVVLVDGVLESRELVIKSMGRYLPKIRGIAGATILGDGSVTPVLDLPELLRDPAERSFDRPINPGDVTGIDVNMPYALVVDDSLSARRSLAQFMSDSGFQVRTARDGVEAVKIIQARQPDVMLVDLEMPRMNGLELTHHVRANDETRDVPVIMITSRSTDKHRQQAKSAGVTHYLTKPYAEDELMETVYSVCTSH